MKKIFTKIADALFDDKCTCILCDAELQKKSGNGLCDNCFKTLDCAGDNICLKCGVVMDNQADCCLNCQNKKREFDKARSPFSYSGLVKDLEYGLKFGAKKYYAKYMANSMKECYMTGGYDADVIVCAPLHIEREKERGYNQSALLAEELAKSLGIEYLPSVVEKHRATLPQARAGAKLRFKNVEGVYRLNDRNALRDKTVLVVDDIMTTGATISALCKELKKGKPKSLLVLTFATARLKDKNL